MRKMKTMLINNQKGLGLLEVMVSMLIVTIGILGIAPLIVMSIEGNVISEEYSNISNSVNQQIEFYQSLDSLPTAPYVKKEENREEQYVQATYIDDHVSDSLVPDGLYRLIIETNWEDNQGVNRSNSVSTYLIPN
ncbi:MAG: hypothetical protein GY865_11315 [candidate division Zixibacteria bacterium]|nr:hypothetical protein [candidate division Zixibacteria bacterium]